MMEGNLEHLKAPVTGDPNPSTQDLCFDYRDLILPHLQM